MMIDEIIENFDPSLPRPQRKECVPLTIWVPKEEKEKYDKIQRVSNREFSKILQQVFIGAINKISGKYLIAA